MSSCTPSFSEKTVLPLIKMVSELLFLKYFWKIFYKLLIYQSGNKKYDMERIF